MLSLLGMLNAASPNASSLHVRRQKPVADLTHASLLTRIEEWALSSVGFVSRSQAAAGFKCADQVSQVLWYARAGIRPTFGVEPLVENLLQQGWLHYSRPRRGCLIYSFIDMPARRSHVGIVVRAKKDLREELLKIMRDYGIQGKEAHNEFLEIQKQLPFVNETDRNNLFAKLERYSRRNRRAPTLKLYSEQERAMITAKILERYRDTDGNTFTVIHNQIAALREGPFDMEDALWMLKARFLCPKYN